jgi:hypothetical protein
MKSLVSATVAALTLAAPLLAFAQQSDRPLTRAEVKAELVRLETAGYRPSSDHTQYPANIQVAERTVSQVQPIQNTANAAPNLAATSFGGVSATNSASGQRTVDASRDSLYRGH